MNGRMHGRWHGAGRGRGPGRGGWQQADLPPATDAAAWLSGRLPDGWFVGAPEVTVDREEIVVVGELPPLEGEFPDTEAGRAGCLAVVRAREPRFYRDAHPGRRPWRVPALWLFAPFEPNHVEDISETFDAKLAAIMCHESQYPTEMGFNAGDDSGRAAFVERMHTMFGMIGARGGHARGEDFRRIQM